MRGVLEDPSIRKAVHNAPVDDHAIHNHGVMLRGCVNTLDLARWAWPELAGNEGFGLKALMGCKLNRQPIAEFKDVVRDTRTVTVTKNVSKTVQVCRCRDPSCRKRKAPHDSKFPALRVSVKVEEKEEAYEHPLETIVPGHPRWELLVRYAAEDAVAALEIEELARAVGDPAPWPYAILEDAAADDRPGYNQGVSDAVVLMERTGFAVDTEYAARQAAAAESDERIELEWLRRWFRKNYPEGCNLTAEQVDSVWSSQPKKIELFDALGFPRSPVWKKGRVKPGEVKMDGAAMEWIAKNHPPAAQLIVHLTKLQRIRSGKKYLEKLAGCGGFVHPICGAAGDGDDRFGAVTGRLGIKGVLEAQQLPSRDDVDLYRVRRAVIACRPSL